MKLGFVFERLLPFDDPGAPLVGAFADGTRFVAAFRKGDASSMLAEWPGPEGDPEAITGLDASVVALDVARDAGRVAIAAVTPEHSGTEAPAPAQLFVLDLRTREGDRYLRPEMRLSFAEDGPPRVLLSDDGRHVAVGGLVSLAGGGTATYVVDVQEKKRVAVLEGRPVQWWQGSLCLEGETMAAWSPADDATTGWSGALYARSPDGSSTLRTTPRGELAIVDEHGATRAVPEECGAEARWTGPHHLRCTDGAFDVRAWSPCALVRGRRESALLRAARLVAVSGDGLLAVFQAADTAHVWALASPRAREGA